MNPNIDVSQLPLRDIHLPDAVAWWPPAIGWWILAALLLAGVGAAAWLYRARWRERAALAAMRRVVAALDAGEEPALCMQRISAVLRRFVMSVHGANDSVAGLTGRRWLAYLDSCWERDAFQAGAGSALVVAPYAPAGRVSERSVREIAMLCADWVAAQRRRRRLC